MVCVFYGHWYDFRPKFAVELNFHANFLFGGRKIVNRKPLNVLEPENVNRESLNVLRPGNLNAIPLML